MPIYEYSCQSCGKMIDVLQKISDPAPATCSACGAEGSMTKVVSRSSFVLKGGGWYSDLYSSTKKDGGGSTSSSSASSSTSSASTPASSAPSTPAPAPAPAASGDKK
ncbi:zinc ribbon domain-containing protein [Myxococcus sp. AM001]|uniref:FmdB family zinc ribbon protein n=1 Tax=Myxococcus vastator TaxID=2709664 RepID=UPI0013D39899|nr:zinc ribbon domain-containing protein [Myxococcus vastator]NVJ04570.1 zinc ribbon domain-containing protein [Myxococcus sp. AM001]